MDVKWHLVLAAVAILVIPTSWLFSAQVKDRLARQSAHWFRLEYMIPAWQNWLDLVRAGLAGYVLAHMAIDMEALRLGGDDLTVFERHLDLIIVGASLAPALWIQTMRFRPFLYCTAPVFFVIGMTLAISPPVPAIFAIAFGVSIARMFDTVDLLFPLTAVFLVGIALLVRQFSLLVVLNAVLAMLPLLIGYASMCALSCFTRRTALAEE